MKEDNFQIRLQSLHYPKDLLKNLKHYTSKIIKSKTILNLCGDLLDKFHIFHAEYFQLKREYRKDEVKLSKKYKHYIKGIKLTKAKIKDI